MTDINIVNLAALLLGSGTLLGSAFTVFLGSYLASRARAKERKLRYLEKRLQIVYNPLLEYLELMKAWGDMARSRGETTKISSK